MNINNNIYYTPDNNLNFKAIKLQKTEAHELERLLFKCKHVSPTKFAGPKQKVKDFFEPYLQKEIELKSKTMKKDLSEWILSNFDNLLEKIRNGSLLREDFIKQLNKMNLSSFSNDENLMIKIFNCLINGDSQRKIAKNMGYSIGFICTSINNYLDKFKNGQSLSFKLNLAIKKYLALQEKKEEKELEINKKMIKLLEDLTYGKLQKDIAKELKLTPSQVSRKNEKLVSIIKNDIDKIPSEHRHIAERYLAILENKALTGKEIKILEGYIAGKSNKEIGKQIGYSALYITELENEIVKKYEKNKKDFYNEDKLLLKQHLAILENKALTGKEIDILNKYIAKKSNYEFNDIVINFSNNEYNMLRKIFKIYDENGKFFPENQKKIIEQAKSVKNNKVQLKPKVQPKKDIIITNKEKLLNNNEELITILKKLIKSEPIDKIAKEFHHSPLTIKEALNFLIDKQKNDRDGISLALDIYLDNYKTMLVKKEEDKIRLQKFVLEGLISGKKQKEICTDYNLSKDKIIQMKKDFLCEDENRKKFAPEIEELIVEYKTMLLNTIKNKVVNNKIINDEDFGIEGYAKKLIKKHNLNLEIENDRKDLYKRVLTYLVQSYFFEEIADNNSLTNILKKYKDGYCVFEIPASDYNSEFIKYTNKLFTNVSNGLKVHFNIKKYN
ncbi:hypothetical protein J6R97_02520 [bacterium]|nr:hypothetical protein [bacterium]